MPQPKVTVPPPEIRGRLKKLDGPATEVETLRGRLRTEQQELAELETKLDAAREADVAAQAAALRAGKPDPGQKATAKADQAIEAKAPRIAALERAAEDAEADLVAAIDEHRVEYREQLLAEAEDQRATARRLVGEAQAAVGDRQRTLALRSWLQRPGRFNPGKLQGQVESLTQPNGSSPSVDVVTAALAEALDAPKPPEPTNPHQNLPAPTPLQHVTR